MSLEYVRTYYKMPFIRRGMMVRYDGHDGYITSAAGSGNLFVRLAGSKRPIICHPQWRMIYYDQQSNVIAEYREFSHD